MSEHKSAAKLFSDLDASQGEVLQESEARSREKQYKYASKSQMKSRWIWGQQPFRPMKPYFYILPRNREKRMRLFIPNDAATKERRNGIKDWNPSLVHTNGSNAKPFSRVKLICMRKHHMFFSAEFYYIVIVQDHQQRKKATTAR